MASVQLMCARLGMVTGQGISSLLRKRYGRGVLWGACVLLVIANVINIGADLGAMGAACLMMLGMHAAFFTPLFAALMLTLLIVWDYRRIAKVLKWLTLVLFAYIIAAVRAHPKWSDVVRFTLVPHIQWSPAYLSMFVALAGTTISPYLFFWQAKQEVEEERAHGRMTVKQRKGATAAEKADSRTDVLTGIFLSQAIMYFIMLTTASTLHAHGVTKLATLEQAAQALEPLAGRAAYLIFTLGTIGTGMLSVPVLAGSSAFAIAEAAGVPCSLSDRPHGARLFYGVLSGALVLGAALNYLGFPVVSMLFWSAVINGLLAPPLLVLLVLMTSDRALMGKHANGPLMRTLGWITAIVMTAAAAGMLLTLGKE